MKAIGSWIWCAGMLASNFLAAGCSSKPTVVEVSGTVTHNGKPVPHLFLNFAPEAGRPSWGMSDANGRFKLNYTKDQDGAQVGMHTVSAQLRPRSPKEDIADRIKQSPELQTVLDKYGDRSKSPMRIEITSDTHEIEVKLD